MAACRRSLLKLGVGVDGVLPYLVRVGSKIDFGVDVFENSRLLVVEIERGFSSRSSSKKRFIAPDDLRVLVEALADPRPQD